MTQRFVVDGVPVELRKSEKRKSRVAFLFKPSGQLVLEAPAYTTAPQMKAMVKEHLSWIRYRLERVQAEFGHVSETELEPGGLVSFLGETYRLRWVEAIKPAVRLTEKELVVRSPDTRRFKDDVETWLHEQAGLEFDRVLKSYRHLPWLGGKLPEWRHRAMRSQWGACSVDGKISLNSHLIKVPRRLIRYVVLHELCHIRHMDHSRRFYGLMERYMADWEARRRALNRYASVMLDG